MDSSELTRDTSGAPQYTAEENERLTHNLEALTTRVHAGAFSDHPLNLELLRELHAGLFGGVRDDHAGRIRSARFGSEHLTFGPNRSAHRRDVESALLRIFQEAVARVRQLEAEPDGSDYDASALQVAIEAHAQIIGVHPFQDGNGRTTRLFMGIILVRLGLHPIPIEACKQEYTDALNVYFKMGISRPLFDLFLSLYLD